MDARRSGVSVMDEMMQSILSVLSDGMSPVNGIFSTRTGFPRNFPSASAMSTLTPSGLPEGPIVSNGGYERSIPTTSVFLSRLPQAETKQAVSVISKATIKPLAAMKSLTGLRIPRFFCQRWKSPRRLYIRRYPQQHRRAVQAHRDQSNPEQKNMRQEEERRAISCDLLKACPERPIQVLRLTPHLRRLGKPVHYNSIPLVYSDDFFPP